MASPNRAGELDPLTVVMVALSLASKDDRSDLTAAILRKHSQADPDLRQVVSSSEHESDGWRGRLQDVLTRNRVDQDQEIVDLATERLRRAEVVQPGITGGVVGQI